MNYFLIRPRAIRPDHIYAFVLLNKPDVAVRYFIVTGTVLANGAERFGMPGIHPKRLVELENTWGHFDRIP